MRGRKPTSTNVVPLTGEDRTANFAAAAKAKARELKPRKLDRGVSKVWDRLAPAVCHPTVNRLKPHTVEAFAMLCRAVAEHEAYCEALRDGETYEVETRNGKQRKSRPEVGQRNEAFRRALTLLRDFGLTPAAERGVLNSAEQGAFDFDEDDFA